MGCESVGFDEGCAYCLKFSGESVPKLMECYGEARYAGRDGCPDLNPHEFIGVPSENGDVYYFGCRRDYKTKNGPTLPE